MTVRNFLKFVEIKTKIASVLPFLLGTAYAFFRFREFNVFNFAFMFASLICFDMATTAINNYIDYKTAAKKEGAGYEELNAALGHGLGFKTAFFVIVLLLAIAVICGIILTLHTNIVVLGLGIFSFTIGILYTYGPMPISRTPFGEIFSGSVMGFLIPFLTVYIHVFNKELILVSFDWADWIFSVKFDVLELLRIFIFAATPAATIANIMLANNICDIKEDIANRRNTLPIWLGVKKSLLLFTALYVMAYLAIIAAVIVGAFPPIYLLGILSGFYVFGNVRRFLVKQVKAETFVLSVKNFVIINLLNLLLICATILFSFF